MFFTNQTIITIIKLCIQGWVSMMKSKLLYERALITCVLMLVICIILKLFGIPWFDSDTSISILNKIDTIVMNSYWLSLLYSSLFTTLNIFLITGMINEENKTTIPKYLFVSFFLITISIFIKACTYNSIVRILIDCITIYVCFIVRYRKVTIGQLVFCYVTNMLYQILSLFIRNISVSTGQYGLVSSVLLNIDYYMLLVIHNLYVRKGGSLCSIFHVYFSSLAKKLWKKPTQNSNQCSSKES